MGHAGSASVRSSLRSNPQGIVQSAKFGRVENIGGAHHWRGSDFHRNSRGQAISRYYGIRRQHHLRMMTRMTGDTWATGSRSRFRVVMLGFMRMVMFSASGSRRCDFTRTNAQLPAAKQSGEANKSNNLA